MGPRPFTKGRFSHLIGPDVYLLLKRSGKIKTYFYFKALNMQLTELKLACDISVKYVELLHLIKLLYVSFGRYSKCQVIHF
jgi:hypothetical protein